MLRCCSVDPGGEDRTIRPDGGGERVREADAALVLAARDGDERAFGRLFDRWFDPVHDIAWRIVRDPRHGGRGGRRTCSSSPGRASATSSSPARSAAGCDASPATGRSTGLDRERRSRPDSDAAGRGARPVRARRGHDRGAGGARAERARVGGGRGPGRARRQRARPPPAPRHGRPRDRRRAGGHAPTTPHQLLHRLKGKLGSAIRAWVLWRGGARRAPASTGRWPMPGSRRSAPTPCGWSTAMPEAAPPATSAASCASCPRPCSWSCRSRWPRRWSRRRQRSALADVGVPDGRLDRRRPAAARARPRRRHGRLGRRRLGLTARFC